jgi:RHS repeat-associated protein
MPQYFNNSSMMYGNFGNIDNLAYRYDPTNTNKLLAVTDNTNNLVRGFKSEENGNDYPTMDDYTYDANGNITSDLNKGIANITYNYLNLPEVIEFAAGNYGSGRTIHFVYDASGVKLRKIVTIPTTYNDIGLAIEGSVTTYDYVDGVEYTNGYLQRIAHTEGYVSCSGSTSRHEYVINDHLGNARVTYTDANNDEAITVNEIAQVNHYYGFGLNMEGNWPGADGSNKYQYNGKEWNDDFGLGWNDYGARFYDAAIGRFFTKDRFAEKYKSLNPYQYAANNPIKFIDVNGDSIQPTDTQRPEFIEEFKQVMKKLKEFGEDGDYQQMESSKTIYKLVETEGTSGEDGSRFDPNTNTLYWNPRVAYFFEETFITISPATVLAHEVSHGARFDNDKVGIRKDQRTPDAEYSNAEEKRVITGPEQRVAKGLKEIKEGEVTRTDHKKATVIPVSGPFSTEIPTSESAKKKN